MAIAFNGGFYMGKSKSKNLKKNKNLPNIFDSLRQDNSSQQNKSMSSIRLAGKIKEGNPMRNYIGQRFNKQADLGEIDIKNKRLFEIFKNSSLKTLKSEIGDKKNGLNGNSQSNFAIKK